MADDQTMPSQDGQADSASSEAANDPRPGPVTWHLVLVLGFLASLPTLTACAARWSWQAELFTHFRVQYVAVLALPTLLLLAGRKWWMLALPGLALVLNVAMILPAWVGSAGEPAAEAAALRVITANVLTTNRNEAALASYIEAAEPDVFVALEINSRWAQALDHLSGYPHRLVKPRDDNFGIGIYSQRPLHNPRLMMLADRRVPTLVVEVEVDDERWTIVATHPLPPRSKAYAQDRNAQLAALAQLVSDLEGPVVVLGDLNVTPWSPMFRDLLVAGELRDTRRGFGNHAS